MRRVHSVHVVHEDDLAARVVGVALAGLEIGRLLGRRLDLVDGAVGGNIERPQLRTFV